MNPSGRPPPYSPAIPELNQDLQFPPPCLTPELTTSRLIPEITTHCVTPEITTHCVSPGITTHCVTPEITTHCVSPGITTHCVTPEITTHCVSPEITTHRLTPDITTCPAQSIQPETGSTKTETQQLSGQPSSEAISREQDSSGKSSILVVILACVLLMFSTFLFVIPFPEMIVGYKYMDICNDWFSIWLCVTGTLLLVTWIYIFLIICLSINTLVLIVINLTMVVVWWSIGMYWCWISPTPLPQYNQPPRYKQRNFGGFFLDEVYLEQFEYDVCRQQFYFVYSLCWVHLCLFVFSFVACLALLISPFIKSKNYPTHV